MDTGIELAAIRNEMLGFIFQQYNLLPKLNLLENVEVPLVYAGVSRAERHKRAREVLEQVGLGDKLQEQAQPALRRPAAARVHRPGSGAQSRPSSWPTSPPALWTATPAARCWGCCRSCTVRATPWSSSPTTIPLPCRPNASSGLEDGRVVYDGDSHAPEAVVQPTLLPEQESQTEECQA